MLVSLHVENIALIKKLSLEFSGGFCVLTGETGAGKSIIIDAVNMLCGARSDRELLRSGEQSALVEGVFGELSVTERAKLAELEIEADEDGLVFLSRKLSADGKATAKINGRTVPVSKLRDAADALIRIHGQQDTRILSDSSSFVELLDRYAANTAELDAYKSAYRRMTELKSKLNEVSTDEDEKRKRAEYLSYAISEIESAKPKADEEEKLILYKQRYQNTEKITQGCSNAYTALYGADRGTVSQLLGICIRELIPLTSAVSELGALADRLESARVEVDDIASTLAGFITEDTTEIAQKLDRIEERLAVLQDLKRKYGGSVEAVLATLEDMKEQLNMIEHTDEYIKQLSSELAAAVNTLKERAEVLHNTRVSAAERFSKQMLSELEFLDMGKLRFEVEITQKDFGSDGADIVRFLLSVNKGEAPKPIEKIASGGELSRIMLALMSVLSKADGAGTIIFDEIDTGISGATSRKIGLKLLKLTDAAEPVQVICVTHSAQIAALADEHIKITKEEKDGRTYTFANELDEQGRIAELSRIIGGIDGSGVITAAAKELLDRRDYYAISK